MRWGPVLVMAMVGCGDDGGTGTRDGGTSAVDASGDGATDAPPPNTRHRGLVQAVYVGTTSSSFTAGFYEEPAGAPGCQWFYQGGCSLAICDPNSAGLVATSAGVITATVGSTPVTMTPSGATYDLAASPGHPPGTNITMSAAGAAVPAFTSGTLVMPTALQVSAPAGGAMVDRAQPLTFTWTGAPGNAYINLSQGIQATPYPAINRYTIRCDVSSQTGSATVPPYLLSQFEPGSAIALAAAQVTETHTPGDYEVQTRLLALDMARSIVLQ